MLIQNDLLRWYDTHGRHDLPWKKPLSAYRVWVSEIMLQQTQVTTVIPYFKRFMKTFPTVDALAKAPLDQVLHHWAGLGYYARARNLHKTAQIIVTQYHGKFPRTAEHLATLPGIGRSTAGAIVAQAYNVRAPILDANVKRVLARLYCIPGWYGNTAVAEQLWALAEKHTPTQRVDDYTQAIMDLGATCCTRTNPDCPQCPLRKKCQAYQSNTQALYPARKPKKAIPLREVTMIILCHNNAVLMEQRPLQGIWGGLWSFPEYDDVQASVDFLKKIPKRKIASIQHLPELKHTFTHFHLRIAPILVQLTTTVAAGPHHWVTPQQLRSLGLPAPIKKLINRAALF